MRQGGESGLLLRAAWMGMRCTRAALVTVLIASLQACGGDGGDTAGPRPVPSLSIVTPSAAGRHDTPWRDVRLGGAIEHAAFVHVVNTATGMRVDGFVNTTAGTGSWFADLSGLAPGDNRIVVTADADGTGAFTASVNITITRPSQPARLAIGGDAGSAAAHWKDTHSFGGGHAIVLYADGTGRSTTGSALAQAAGPVTAFAWSYDGAEAIVVVGCAACSFQRIDRMAGGVNEGLLLGRIETVGGASDAATHAFQLTPGAP